MLCLVGLLKVQKFHLVTRGCTDDRSSLLAQGCELAPKLLVWSLVPLDLLCSCFGLTTLSKWCRIGHYLGAAMTTVEDAESLTEKVTNVVRARLIVRIGLNSINPTGERGMATVGLLLEGRREGKLGPWLGRNILGLTRIEHILWR